MESPVRGLQELQLAPGEEVPVADGVVAPAVAVVALVVRDFKHLAIVFQRRAVQNWKK